MSAREQLSEFVELLQKGADRTGVPADFFAKDRGISIARAPGRLDVMGGIADYSGSLVLELPIAEGTLVAAQKTTSSALELVTRPLSGPGELRRAEVPLAALHSGVERARAHFENQPSDAWCAYVVGALVVLAERHPQVLGSGGRLFVASSVPEGKGVASSAALSVAAMLALVTEHELALERTELALLCQRVENEIAGAPSGVMDQMTSALGEQGRLLELLCQPAKVLGQLPIPDGIQFFGIDSGLRHAVSGSDYGAVRVGAFMGYRIIAEREGFPVRAAGEGRVTIEDTKYRGYLANLGVERFVTHHLGALPEALSGREFLERYGGSTDRATRVDPGRTYAVRAATAHPVYEHERVQAFSELLRQPLDERTLIALGRLMAESHASYGACGLGSDGTDELVRLVTEAGPRAGLYGAKITGGGSGGTVAVLGRTGSVGAVERIAAQYQERTGRAATVFAGSSPGALAFGARRLQAPFL